MFRGKNVGAEDKIGKFANWLLALENSRSVRLLFVGAPELQRLFHIIDASDERKGGTASLKPFAFKKDEDKVAFASFVETFVADLPFVSTCLTKKGRCDDDMLHYLFYATRGRAGALSKLIEWATIEAFEDVSTKGCPDTLELRHLQDAFDYLLINDDCMLGVNPFRVASTQDLQTIPYNLEEEEKEFARQELAKKKQPKNRKGRSLHPK